MESIIIWIVIIVAGYVFEQIKKRAERKKAEEEALNRHNPIASSPSHTPAPYIQEVNRALHRPAPTMAAKPAPFREKAQQPIRQDTATPVHDISSSPTKAYKPLDIAVNETPMEIAEHPDDQSRTAHYDRWRQAILDTQILEKKF